MVTMMRTREDVIQTIESNAQNLPILGWMVTWGVRRATIRVDDLRRLLDNAGLSKDEVPTPAVRTSCALKRALGAMAEDGWVEQIADTNEKLVYAVAHKIVDAEAEDMSVYLGHKVAYKKAEKNEAERLVFSSDRAAQVLRPKIDMYAASWVSRDITWAVFLRVVKAHSGIPVRPEGGVYFVPANEEATLRKLQNVAEALNAHTHGDTYISLIPVVDNAEAKRNMQRHATHAALAEIRQMEIDLDTLAADERAGKVRQGTVERAIARINDLGERVALYRDMLEYQVGDLDKALERLRKGYRAVMTGDLTVARAAAAPAKASKSSYGEAEF